MCRNIYDWNIVKCDVKQPNSPHDKIIMMVIKQMTLKYSSVFWPKELSQFFLDYKIH